MLYLAAVCTNLIEVPKASTFESLVIIKRKLKKCYLAPKVA